jgi:hypothetical protein
VIQAERDSSRDWIHVVKNQRVVADTVSREKMICVVSHRHERQTQAFRFARLSWKDNGKEDGEKRVSKKFRFEEMKRDIERDSRKKRAGGRS